MRMLTPGRYLTAVVVCALCAPCPNFGSLRAAPAPDWQPYREAGTELSLPAAVGVVTAGAETPSEPASVALPRDGSVRTAQLPYDMVVFPQPVCDASPCDVSCYMDSSAGPPTDPAFWQWRLLPSGVVWQSYWAGVNESRISGTAFNNQGVGLLDVTLGGRTALVRYGTSGPRRPQGAELQIEGAGSPRLNLDENWDLESSDFRFGVPFVYGREKWQTKLSYYHLSSHMGDEFVIRNQAANALGDRINFSRDVLVWGLSYFPLPAWRWYAEAGWAFHYDESEPWEFQFGVDVAEPGPTDFLGTPFIAINGHIREEVDFGGHVVFQAGWLWRGETTNTVRAGFHYLNGKSSQLEFHRQFEHQIGGGLWCDF